MVDVPSTSPPLLIASVPSSHVYVRHIAALDEIAPAVVRLADPDPDAPGRSTVERWWPPMMLDPSWLRAAHYDILHLQFGFDARDPEKLRVAMETVRDRGIPFVHTVHDLRNPHHREGDLHTRQLEVLMEFADAVITLTPGAATEIHRRWGRAALVLPHPHVVDFTTMRAHRAHRARQACRSRCGSPHAPRDFRVGLHVKSLRANMDPLTVLPVLEESVAQLPGAVLQVNGHRDVLDHGSPRRDDELADHLEQAERRGQLELHVHDYMSDASLWNYLGRLDASVLPYRFGTHSGWLEACRDLGTAVIAPTCGYYADQGPVYGYEMDEDHFDPDSLSRAVVRAYEERPAAAVGVDERRRQRAEVAAAHESLYRRLLT